MCFLQRRLLRRKKGASIIEIVVSISISFLIISILIPIYLETYNSYKATIIQNRDYFYAKDAFAYIESELTQNTISASVNNNKICIKKSDGMEKEILTVVTNNNIRNIQVDYYKNNVFQASNIVLRNIKDFSIKVKNNILYVSITLIDEFLFERCLPLNYLK